MQTSLGQNNELSTILKYDHHVHRVIISNLYSGILEICLSNPIVPLHL